MKGSGVYKCYRCGSWKPKKEIEYNQCKDCRDGTVDLSFLLEKIKEKVEEDKLLKIGELTDYLSMMVPLLEEDSKIEVITIYKQFVKEHEKNENNK